MKRSAGQYVAEVVTLSAILIAIIIGSLVFFGDNIKNIFENNKILSFFQRGSERTNFQENLLSYISNVQMNNYQSPLEQLIKEKLKAGTIQTSGSSGLNTKDYATLASKYLDAIKGITSNPNSNISESTSKSIEDFIDNTFAMIDMDLVIGTGDNISSVKYLEFLLSLKQGGEGASEIQSIIDSLGNTDEEKALKLYLQDLLALGESLNFYVDDVAINELNELYNETASSLPLSNDDYQTLKSVFKANPNLKDYYQNLSSGTITTSEKYKILGLIDKMMNETFTNQDLIDNQGFLNELIDNNEVLILAPNYKYVANSTLLEEGITYTKQDGTTVTFNNVQAGGSTTNNGVTFNVTKDGAKYIVEVTENLGNYQYKINKYFTDFSIINTSAIKNSEKTTAKSVIQGLIDSYNGSSTSATIEDKILSLINYAQDNVNDTSAAINDLLPKIHVFTDKPLSSILASTYNNQAFCDTLGGTVLGGECSK